MAKKRARINQDLFADTTKEPEEEELVGEEAKATGGTPPRAERAASEDEGEEGVAAEEGKTDSSEGEEEVETRKATYYLTPETLDRITLAQVRLRQLTGKRGHDMSKSVLVEAALRVVLTELEEKGSDSEIATLLSGQ